MKESTKTNTSAAPFAGKALQTEKEQETRLLAELEARLSRLDLPCREIPSSLDRAVLDYAVQLQKERSLARQKSIVFIRKYALGLAAALALCFGLTFILKQPERTAREMAAVSPGKGNVYLSDDQELMNMELFLLSSSIRSSSERLTRTAAFSAALDLPR